MQGSQALPLLHAPGQGEAHSHGRRGRDLKEVGRMTSPESRPPTTGGGHSAWGCPRADPPLKELCCSAVGGRGKTPSPPSHCHPGTVLLTFGRHLCLMGPESRRYFMSHKYYSWTLFKVLSYSQPFLCP